MSSFWLALLIGCCLFVVPIAVAQQVPPLSTTTNNTTTNTTAPGPAASTTDLSGLKEFFFNLITERDRQYGQRFDAQEKALAAALVSTEKATAAAFAAQEKATASAFSAAKEAVTKAEIASEKRFDNVNEFRGSLRDQATTFVQRSESDVRFKAVNDKLEVLTAQVIAINSRSEGAGNLWVLILGGLGLLVSLVAIIYAIRRAVP